MPASRNTRLRRSLPSISMTNSAWGRGLMTTESLRLRTARQGHCRASMGPWSYDHGKIRNSHCLIRRQVAGGFNGAVVL
jgi:hypothetical protein